MTFNTGTTDSQSTSNTTDLDHDSTQGQSTPLDTGGGRGLNDNHLSYRRRRLLDLMNRLMATGAQLDIDLPQIAVLGGQSAGKSSLIESISGITLPRASGTCTRCATECRLSYSSRPWQCEVFLRFIVDEDDVPLAQIREIKFGSTISDRREVEDRLRNAQLAILNPSTFYETFLEDYTPPSDDPQLSFSRNYISIHISGPDVADLSFCDLPGLIATVTRGGNQGDIQLVESLLESYIAKPSCLILLTVTCETDFETQGAYTLASRFDPEGKRTIGVLTKPDRIPTGDEASWIQFIKNEEEPLQHRWFCVKQPDSQQLKQGITWEQARANEAAFFSAWVNSHPALGNLRSQLGTPKLVASLSEILSDLIAKRLPEIQKELQALLDDTNRNYEKLPKALTGRPLTEMLSIIDQFKSSIDKLIEGDPDDPNGLMQTIHKKHDQLRDGLRSQAPDFRPLESSRYNGSGSRFVPVFAFLQNEGDSDSDYNGNGKTFFVTEVKERAANAWTRELPGFVPYRVTQALIEESIAGWRASANVLLTDIRDIIISHCKKILNDHFSQFDHTGLLSTVTFLVLDHINEKFSDAEKHINWLFSLEEEPFTINTQLETYKRNFFQSYLRHTRLVVESSPVSRPMSVMSQDDDHALSKLNSFSNEDALEIMATVRAYYQVSFRRFADNVALGIDKDLVRGVARDIRDILREKVISGEGTSAAEKCRELLREQPAIAAKRLELQRKLDRLNAARQELMQIF